MKEYIVMLTSLAKVENSVWEYGGVIDDNIEIQSVVVRSR